MQSSEGVLVWHRVFVVFPYLFVGLFDDVFSFEKSLLQRLNDFILLEDDILKLRYAHVLQVSLILKVLIVLRVFALEGAVLILIGVIIG